MSHSTKSNESGFTLIELLVSTLIVAGLAMVSVNMLWNVVSSRANQNSIEVSTDGVRTLLGTVSGAITAATGVKVVDSVTIQITGTPCRTIKYNSGAKALQQAIDSSALCTPPAVTGPTYTTIHSPQIQIQTFTLSPVASAPASVTISITGTYKDSLASHPFSYYTTVTPRITL